MHVLCGKCNAPLILHRVRWQRSHLAHCHSCNADLRQETVQSAPVNEIMIEAVAGVFSMLNAQDKETFAAVHFLEAFVDRWISREGRNLFVHKTNQYGFQFDADAFREFPLLSRTVAAYHLWHGQSGTLQSLISDKQRYFNLVVRDFGCPDIMLPFHQVLRQEIDLTKELVQEVAMQIRAAGGKPTVQRISKRLRCSTDKLRRFTEEQ